MTPHKSLPLSNPPIVTSQPSQDFWAAGALTATCFAIYMSLVPLDFRPLVWADALDRMQTIGLLKLGVYSRADWIANGVVFAPIGFLWCATLTSGVTRGRLLLATVVCALCVALAYGLEYTQVFFRGRTTSLNDIYAEIIGGVGGAIAWLLFGKPLSRLLVGFSHTFVPAARALLVLYFTGYLLITLFPYDFLLSVEELSDRFARAPATVLPANCNDFRCAAGLLLEVGAAVPIGLLVLFVPWRRRPSHATLFLLGAGLGLGVEVVQALTYSGTVQGVSLITRALGVVAGRMVAEAIANAGWSRIEPWLRPAALCALAPYALVLAYGNHWTATVALSPTEIWATVMGQSWIPFHYYYIGPEVSAVKKLVYQSSMYAPLGMLFWAFTAHRSPPPGWLAAAAGVALAGVMSIGRIATYPGIGPDPTTLLIAGLAAYLGYRGALFFAQLATGKCRQHEPIRPKPDHAPQVARRLVAAALTIVTLVLAASYPFNAAGTLLFGLALYALAIQRWRRLWLVAVPLGIPLLDRGLETGMLLVNEFDLFVLTTLAALLWRRQYPGWLKSWWGTARWILAAFVVLVAIAVVNGWTILNGLGPATITRIDGSDNVVLRAKSLLLILPLLPYLVAALKEDEKAFSRLALGWILGLSIASLAVLWERYVFIGIFDFTAPFRASGPFSSMALGGAALDLYLVMALPFAAHGLIVNRRLRLLASVACVLGLYALVVTYTRTSYAAAGIAFATLGWFSLTSARRTLGQAARFPGAALITALVAGLALAATTGHMGTRFKSALEEAPQRIEQLVEAVRPGLARSLVFGAGAGTFPSLNISESPLEAQPGRGVIAREGRRHKLELHGGRAIYFDQRLRGPIGPELTVTVRTRSVSNTSGGVFVCVKHLMNSSRCVSSSLPASGDNRWKQHTIVLDTRPVQRVVEENPAARSTVYLTLVPPKAPGAQLWITDVAVKNVESKHQLRNGRFEQGNRGWYFTQDDHTLWHLENLWGTLLFELGIPGAALFLALTVYLLARTLAAVRAERACKYPAALAGAPGVVLASLAGMHVLALTDGVFDVPRIGAGVWLLYALALGVTAPLSTLILKEAQPSGHPGSGEIR